MFNRWFILVLYYFRHIPELELSRFPWRTNSTPTICPSVSLRSQLSWAVLVVLCNVGRFGTWSTWVSQGKTLPIWKLHLALNEFHIETTLAFWDLLPPLSINKHFRRKPYYDETTVKLPPKVYESIVQRRVGCHPVPWPTEKSSAS